MRRSCSWLLLAIVGLAASVGVQAQYEDDYYYDDPNTRNRPPQPVFLLNDRILNLAMDRIADGMVNHYGLDDDQLYQTRELFRDRFPSWVMDNRPQIITLMNQYMEGIMGEEPPTPEQVADWAQRARPLVEEFEVLFRDTADEMRVYMTDEQRTILDGEMAVFDVAMDHMQGKLQVWEQGGYDWTTEWPRSDEFEKADRQRREQVSDEALRAKAEALGREFDDEDGPGAAGGPGAAPDGGDEVEPTPRPNAPGESAAPGAPKDEWEQYTEQFIQRYQLNEAQRNAAYKILEKMQDRRNVYLRRKLHVIEGLEKRVASAEGEERERVRGQYERLMAPLDRYFDMLKDRLDRLPTREQRADAARRGSEQNVPADKEE